MKKLLILIILISGCKASLVQKNNNSDLKLAWTNSAWTQILVDEISKKNWPSDIKTPCPKKIEIKECVAQLLSIMSKYESNFNLDEIYKEDIKDAKGEAVLSRGLLQISQESANQKAYGCNIKNAKDLHDVKTNLSCAVNILYYQASKSKTLMSEPKLGCASYWSVCRESSKSNVKIKSYLDSLGN